jgi:hypothetical protein
MTHSDQSADPSPSSDVTTSPTPPGLWRRISRIIAYILAVILLAIGGKFLRDGIHMRSQCEIAQGAEVCDLAFDVAEVGRHVAPLKQIAAFTCQQYIRVDPGLRPGEDPKTMLEGLHLEVSVRNEEGDQVAWCEMPSPYADPVQQQGILFETFPPMALGEYKVVVDVTSAAPALAGRPVRLVSGYVLCGLEWMGSTFGIAIGATSALIGASLAAGLWLTRQRTPREHRITST